MKLWLISQSDNNGYDTYDSAVVAAKDEQAARETHPSHWGEYKWIEGAWRTKAYNGDIISEGTYSIWTHPDNVQVEYLGETERGAGIVCASFNAG